MIAAHLDDVLERRFRVRCAEEGTSIKDKLTEMVERELARTSEDDDVPVRASLR